MATYTTRFDIGDKVYPVESRQVARWVPCAFCKATGHIHGADGSARSCPECFGRKGDDVWEPERWRVLDEMTVGMIKITLGPGGDERYMLKETGIGSGQLWRAENLFGSKDDAEWDCVERNPAPVIASQQTAGPTEGE